MNPNRMDAINSDEAAKERWSLFRIRRRTAYTKSVTVRAMSNAKLNTPPPERASKNMECAVPKPGLY
jgi:hypothetical protein